MDSIYILQLLLSNVNGYGTDEQPITISTLKALLIETIKEAKRIQERDHLEQKQIFNDEDHY